MSHREFICALRLNRPAPRLIGVWQGWWLKPARPSWLKVTNDDQSWQFDHFESLLREGEILWGHVVQANALLWSPGNICAPGTVIFSFEQAWSDSLMPLAKIAGPLFGLKEGGGRTPEEKRYGEMLADEVERAMNWHVPKTRTGGHQVRSTSLYFDRRQLPGGYLSRPYFPILASPEIPAATLLPLSWWSREARQIWDELD